MATPVDFPKYLQFLVESYQEKEHLYTLTDLQVEVWVEISPQEKSQPPSPKNKPETKIDAESSPWVKGFVGFLEGVSEDVN